MGLERWFSLLVGSSDSVVSLVSLHVSLSTGCLSFLTAWWLGPYSEYSTKELGKSYIVLYDLASEVILYYSCHNHKIWGEEISGSIKVIL